MTVATFDGQAERTALLANAKRIVVKIGSRLLAESPAGRPAAIADQIAYLRGARQAEFLVVTSGAISLGVRALGLPKRPAELPELQAAAAVGQGKLMQYWEHAFSAHSLITGQVLLTHDDVSDRRRFLSARHSLRAMLDFGVIPIVNENDTVANEEIKYGDNDMLSALICNLVSADVLLLLTDVEGLRDQNGQRIPVVRDIDREASPLAGGTTADGVGSGGMASKVQAAKIAGRSRIPTLVVPGRSPNVLAEVLGGADVGTLFIPSAQAISSRKSWIAYGAKPLGRLRVDAGAHAALLGGGSSLLPRGITGVDGHFGQGDIISLVGPGGTEFGRGLAGYSSAELERLAGKHSNEIEPTLGYKYWNEAVHRDDLVIL